MNREWGKRLPDYLENGDCFVKTATIHPSKQSFFSGGSPAVELLRGYGQEMDYKTVMNGWS